MPRRLAVSVLSFVGLFAATGCGTAPRAAAVPRPPDHVAWRVGRLEEAVARLSPSPLSDVGLARGPGLGAWAWADGRIRVTAALVDLLDDDELAAVLAHEVGHLRESGAFPRGPAGIRGEVADRDREIVADTTGCALLAARGVPPAAMVRMLVRFSATEPIDAGRVAAAARACSGDQSSDAASASVSSGYRKP